MMRNLPALKSATPFANNDGLVPPPGEYSGPLFVLNHAWPTQPLGPIQNAPWRQAIQNGEINVQNAPAYAAALKKAVEVNGRALIMNYATRNAAKARWYNEPWLSTVREAVHGAYDAGEFGPDLFPNTGLTQTFRTTVVTYFDERAAQTLHKVWGPTAMAPAVTTDNTQFAEGSIIVKAAVFYSTDPKKPLGWWTAMDGAQVWTMYHGVGPQEADNNPVLLAPGYVAQFDIIVKDSKSAPRTGWVFTTLVYDKSAPGDVWDKMVTLGAQWGNDPQANQAGMPLKENWINPRAPVYSTQTLGFGGRLSGPNDGARNDISVNNVSVIKNAPDSGCMSCHSTAQWNVQAHKMDRFLLPSFPVADPPGFRLCLDNSICSPAPGSAFWMDWFQDRLGSQAMSVGSIATDFDETLSFKSLPSWWAAVGNLDKPIPLFFVKAARQGSIFNQYNGAPISARVLKK